jgi:hypothetical protein
MLRKRSEGDGNFEHAYLGRLVNIFTLKRARVDSRLRLRKEHAETWFTSLISRKGKVFMLTVTSLNKIYHSRAYYGNTTMDAEVSLLMANQALVVMSL